MSSKPIPIPGANKRTRSEEELTVAANTLSRLGGGILVTDEEVELFLKLREQGVFTEEMAVEEALRTVGATGGKKLKFRTKKNRLM